MTVQSQTLPVYPGEFILTLTVTKAFQADRCDYGFDFNEQELIQEMSAPLSDHLTVHPHPNVDADDFETLFHYFIS